MNADEITSYHMSNCMNHPLKSLPASEYQHLWSKCTELSSFHSLCGELESTIVGLKSSVALNSIHYRYRLPWMTAKPGKQYAREKLFSKLRPEKDKIVRSDDAELISFIADVASKKKEMVLKFAQWDPIKNKESSTLQGIGCTTESFVASMVIPSLFSNFIGQKNIDDFIESVGYAFDFYSNDQESFILSFESSFLCRVIREFFFAPFLREFIGEQFTIFSDFFSYPKMQNDKISFTRFQRFSTLFFTEFLAPFSVAPSFIKKLFQRISAKYNPQHLIVTVLLNSIIIPMVSFPTTFGVLPINSYFKKETSSTLKHLRYYISSICGLPKTDLFRSMPEIKPVECVDVKLILTAVDQIMSPLQDIPWDVPNLEDITMTVASIKKIAKLMDNSSISQKLEALQDDVIYGFNHNKKLSVNCFSDNRAFQITLKAIQKIHPTMYQTISPSLRADMITISTVNLHNFDEAVDLEIEKFINKSIDSKMNLRKFREILQSTQKAFRFAEASLCMETSIDLYSQASIENEINKKRNLYIKDSNAFCTFFTSVIDNYHTKNQWVSPLLPHIAKGLFTIIMKKFTLQHYIEAHPDLLMTDQNFLAQKHDLLLNFEKTGYDEKVATLMESESILSPALNTVLRACLYENPIESSKEIVLALSTVEDLFSFQYGEPPEANQLMPLLAHLFMLNSVPAPLSFGKWLAHFMQPILDKNPEWFREDNLNSLEHYFQFNFWMEDMIPGIEHNM